MSLPISQEFLSSLADESFANKIDPLFGISNRDVAALRLMQYYMSLDPSSEPTEYERSVSSP